MSAESQFYALLSGHAALTAEVDDRIAVNAVPEGSGYPCVAFAVRTDNDTGATLLGYNEDALAVITVECWATNPGDARALADLVRAAVDTADAARCAHVSGDTTVFDEEHGLDGVQLQVEWWP